MNEKSIGKALWHFRRIFLMPFLALWVTFSFTSASNPSSLKFATQPTHQTAVLGSTVVLPCRVISSDATVQWTRDGFGLGTIRRLQGFDRYSMIGSDEEGDFSLRISPVTLEDNSVYQCQVSTKGGPKLRSRVARLTVNVPPDAPTISPAPDVYATAGVNVSIKCQSVGGRPAPEIQWIDETAGREFREGILFTKITMEDGLRVRATSTLTFMPTRYHHLRTLTCLTHNPALNEPLGTHVTLRIKFPPEIDLKHKPEELSVGSETKVICHAEANPSNVRYKWLRKGKVVSGATGATLNLGVLTREDHGSSIACEATNAVGTIRRTQSLNVKYAPRFESAPESESSDPETEVTLRCDVDGNPQPHVTWQHVESNAIVGEGLNLKLRATKDTAGTYLCVAHSRGYDPLEGRLHLRLRGPPVISASRTVAARKGQSAELRCQAKAVPHPLAVTWMKNGATINPDANGRVIISEKQRADGVLSLLRINYTEDHDFAPYNCSVVNEYGIDIQQIILHREPTIPIIVIVGGGLGVVVIVAIIIMFILCGRKPKPAHEPEKSVETGNGTDPSPHAISIGQNSSSKSSNHNSILKNDVTVLPSILNHDVTAMTLRPKADLRISDNDSDTKEIDNRTGSSLSAVDRESETWDGSDRSMGTLPHQSLHYQRYTQPAIFNSQNQAYLTYSDFGRGFSPAPVGGDTYNQFKMGLPYARSSPASDPPSSLPSSAAPPPYSPTPNGVVGMNGLTSRTTGAQNGRLSNGFSTTGLNGITSLSSGPLRHDLIADLQQPDLTRETTIPGRTELCLKEQVTKENSNYHSKFILPPQATMKPGTLV